MTINTIILLAILGVVSAIGGILCFWIKETAGALSCIASLCINIEERNFPEPPDCEQEECNNCPELDCPNNPKFKEGKKNA